MCVHGLGSGPPSSCVPSICIMYTYKTNRLQPPPPSTQSLILTPPHQKQTKPIAIINQVVRKSYRVSQGPHFALAREKKAAELTKEMLDSGEWATAAFKVGPSVRPSVSLVSLVL